MLYLWAIVRELAPIMDTLLSDAVYSYRLKPKPTKDELFKESDALRIPFLKSKDISLELDPFEAWYAAWPDFEEASKDALGEGFKYLAVSDIAAYFENISITLLHEQLLSQVHNENKVCNIVHETLMHWALRTETGNRAPRGIPQGSSISSFFGNIYLIPIDHAFHKFSETHE